MSARHVVQAALLLAMAVFPATAQEVRENTAQVQAINAFADAVMRAHRHRLDTRTIRETARTGGYARMPEYFNEVTYHDDETGHVLSRIRWIRDAPGTPQMVELFFYDDQGRLSVDYFVSYLINARNAPVSALVNVHHYDDDLHAFRQFDTYGDVTLEVCEGTHVGAPVDVHLDFMEIPPPPERVSREVYTACFGLLPESIDRFRDATDLLPPRTETDHGGHAFETVERPTGDNAPESGYALPRNTAHNFRINQMGMTTTAPRRM